MLETRPLPDTEALSARIEVIGLRAAAEATSGALELPDDLVGDLKQACAQARERAMDQLDVAPDLGIAIDAPWLAAWLSLRLTDEGFLEQHLHPADSGAHATHSAWRFSPQHTFRVVRALCNYLRYVLYYFVAVRADAEPGTGPSSGAQPLALLPDAPEVALFDREQLLLLTEYAHYIGVPTCIPLHAWLEVLYRPELALYALSEPGGYRQHLFHVQDVCLLGLALLDMSVGDERLVSLLAPPSVTPEGPSLSHRHLEANWCVAALLHDVGCVFETLGRSAGALEATRIDLMKQLATRAGHAIDAAVAEALHDVTLDTTPSRTAAALQPEAHHSRITTACLVSELLRHSSGGDLLSRFAPALAAITEHDVRRAPARSSREPLSLVAVVCDQVQEFGRPRINSDRLAAEVLSLRHGRRHSPAIVLSDMDEPSELLLRGAEVHSGSLAIGQSGLDFLVDLDEVGLGTTEPAVIWVDACQRLQGEPSSWPGPPIRITYTHTCRLDRRQPDLYRLMRLAEERSHQYGGLRDWCRLLASGAAGMRYERTVDGDSAREQVEFDVLKLAVERPMRCEIPNLYRAMRRHFPRPDPHRFAWSDGTDEQ